MDSILIAMIAMAYAVIGVVVTKIGLHFFGDDIPPCSPSRQITIGYAIVMWPFVAVILLMGGIGFLAGKIMRF